MKFDPKDPLRNPNDPIHQSGPEAGRALFRRVGMLASGFPQEAVLDAACNLVINCIRQQKPTWISAEASYDEIWGKMKTLLRDHYDANGKRRSVFPFDQHIVMPFHDDSDKSN